MTDFPGRTERHWGGMVEGHEPSLDPAQPAVSPVRGFGGDGARRRRYRSRSTMSPNKRNKAQARNGILSRYLKFFFAKTFHGKVSPFQKPFLNTFLGEGA